MAKFSERMGLVTKVLQEDSMDDALSNALWNAVYRTLLKGEEYRDSLRPRLLQTLWADHFGERADEFLYAEVDVIKQRYFAGSWSEKYDFIEFVASCDLAIDEGLSRKWLGGDFRKACNEALVKHISAYRLIEGFITRITSDEEIAAMEQALGRGGIFDPVAEHLTTALARFSDRTSPDYRNSIKESISAVEATCKIITGDKEATLGAALKRIGVHKALESGFGAIYGYTSDADGIRHALLTESSLNADDAKFYLVSCSAFVNYLKCRASAP
jgi:hypothetical protein